MVRPFASIRPVRSLVVRGFDLRLAALALAVPALLAGCMGDKPPAEAPPAPAATGSDAPKLEPFDAAGFDATSAQVTNPYMPFKPGMHFVYEGETVEDDGTVVPHRFESYVTDLTKEVGGVRSVVLWDLDYSDGELVEAELAFFAQDKNGTVWRMGEYPEEYDGKKVVAHPAWLHGLEGASAGIEMQASPTVGTPDYSQGWGPAVNWTDRAQVDSVAIRRCVPVDCYDDVVVTAETSATEANAHQLKYYARGVGGIYVGWRGAGEKTKETLALVKLEQLDAKGLAEVRTKALELEKNAYKLSPDLYGKTSPCQPASGS